MGVGSAHSTLHRNLPLAHHLRSQRLGTFVKDIEIRLICIAALARDLAYNVARSNSC